MRISRPKSTMRCSATALAWAAITIATILCSPSSAAELRLDNFYGQVTEQEITRFKAAMEQFPLPADNIGNDLTYGSSAERIIALGKMYEVTGDRAILDQMIVAADHMLAARNDTEDGRVVWTGRREPVWPNRREDDQLAKLVEAEQGEIVGHIAYCALLILENEPLWDEPVAVGDEHGLGRTYRQRAEGYVDALEQTVQDFILPHFVDSQTRRMYRPSDQAWKDLGERQARDAGGALPWNQQSMLANGFQRLAACHEILGNDDKARQYDAIVQAALDWFIEEALISDTTDDGISVVRWAYAGTGDRYIEGAFGHGQATVQMLVRADQSSRYDLPSAAMARLSDTLIHAIAAKGESGFHSRVDGEGDVSQRQVMLPLARYDALVWHLNLAATQYQTTFSSPLTFAQHIRIKDHYNNAHGPTRDSSKPYLRFDFDPSPDDALNVSVTAVTQAGAQPLDELQLDHNVPAGVSWSEQNDASPALTFSSGRGAVRRSDDALFHISEDEDFRIEVAFTTQREDAHGPLFSRQRSDRATWRLWLDGSDLQVRTWGDMHRDVRESLDLSDVIEPGVTYRAVFERRNGRDVSFTLYDEHGDEIESASSESTAAAGCTRPGNIVSLGGDTQDHYLTATTIHDARARVGQQQLRWPGRAEAEPNRVQDISGQNHHGRIEQERGSLVIDWDGHELYAGAVPRVPTIKASLHNFIGPARPDGEPAPDQHQLTLSLETADQDDEASVSFQRLTR